VLERFGPNGALDLYLYDYMSISIMGLGLVFNSVLGIDKITPDVAVRCPVCQPMIMAICICLNDFFHNAIIYMRGMKALLTIEEEEPFHTCCATFQMRSPLASLFEYI
jgi:hypothetical protein